MKYLKATNHVWKDAHIDQYKCALSSSLSRFATIFYPNGISQQKKKKKKTLEEFKVLRLQISPVANTKKKKTQG